MKALFLSLALISTAHAANVDCVSDDQMWASKFQLEGDSIFNLEITKNGNVVRKNKQPEGGSYRFLKVRYYEYSLGGAKYFNFERKIINKEEVKEFPAQFLLTNNPLGFEKHVNCVLK